MSTHQQHAAHSLYTEGEPVADTKAPEGPIAQTAGPPASSRPARQPGQPPQAHRHRRRHRPRGRRRRGDPRRGGLPRQVQFCFQDSPRRAHSIAAQGGINAAKNYNEDGDSRAPPLLRHRQGRRLPRPRVQRLPPRRGQREIIDQCVAQGVPFAREYGGLLDTRSFGGVQVSRTFYARGQTGQQLLLGAYQALERQIAAGKVEMSRPHEMLDLVVVDGMARGIVARDLITGEIYTYFADAVVLASGGYGNVFYLSTNAMGSNATASGGRTAAARTSPTPASRRSTPPASRAPASTSPSSR